MNAYVLKLLSLVYLIASLLNLLPAGQALAASSSNFQSGRIIDDSFFFNPGTMSAGEIQNFLNSKVPTCDTNGTQPISSGSSTTRAEWAAANGKPQPPYTCLKDYSQSIPDRAPDAYCSGAIGGGTKSAAQIIKDVSVACNTNPQSLIVLLQKEQSLITDDWPWPRQYEAATGYACPDTAPCDPEFAGFFNQVYYGARQFQRYIKQASSFNYRVGQTSYVLYNPNVNCGGTNIFLQTQATAALYNYTPYQPNTAALNNLYGTGDSCSAYGNRNFWRLFNDWFGPTTSDSDANTVSFVRLNHSSGRAELAGVSSISSYQAMSRYSLTGYPAVPADGSVIPITTTSISSVSFVRLNHSSGRAELVTFSSASGYQQIIDYQLTSYPAIAPDGAVIPLLSPNGNLNFVRLNHSSGRVEVATFSWQSGYKNLVDYRLVAYPAVPPDGAVIPLFNANGNLSLVRLNHSSARTEIATFSASSGYQQLVDYKLTGYPAVLPDGAVRPLINPAGNLSLIRLNHSSGKAEIATFSASSGYQQLVDYRLVAYPSVSDFNEIETLVSR